MKTKLLLFFALVSLSIQAQVISIVGTGVNGWPDNMTGPEMDMATTDNITYTLTGVSVSAGQVKFRQDHDWATNWGGSTFPSGTGILNGSNIVTTAGTYDITFNRSNGTYTFIGTSAFPAIGIWGPAVDSQNGFGGADVDMTTTDGIIYKLSAFNFSSGSGVFRQDNNPMMTFGSVAFPSGTAVAGGPNILVTGGQYSVTFNRLTGDYSFDFPSVGILGTFNNWDDPDFDLTTTDGETYFLENLVIPTGGYVKLRVDDDWTINWGGDVFPNGTMVLNGPDMLVVAGTYNVNFNRFSAAIQFTEVLRSDETNVTETKVFPNPTANNWEFSGVQNIDSIVILDLTGKQMLAVAPNENMASIDASGLANGIYFARIVSGKNQQVIKLIKL